MKLEKNDVGKNAAPAGMQLWSAVQNAAPAGLFGDPPGAPQDGPKTRTRQQMAEILEGTAFEMVSCTVTLVNAGLLGMSAEAAMSRAVAGTPEEEPPVIFAVGLYFFSAFYILECVGKVCALGCAYWTGPNWKWNCFDFLLVLAACYEVASALSGFSGGSVFILVLRLLRIFKLMRLVRLMRFFSELRVMLVCLIGAMRTLFWTVVMLALIMYIFGLAFLNAATHTLAQSGDLPQDTRDAVRDSVLEFWGSVPGSMITLFEVITGGNDWSASAQLFREHNKMYYVLFLFYILFQTIAVLNVLTGIFVDAAMAVEHNSKFDQLEADKEAEGSMLYAMYELYGCCTTSERPADVAGTSAHIDDHGWITWSEFESSSDSKVVQDFFCKYSINTREARRLFERMGGDGPGARVIAREFINGLAQFREPVQSSDITCIMYESKKFSMILEEFMTLRGEGNGPAPAAVSPTHCSDRSFAAPKHSSSDPSAIGAAITHDGHCLEQEYRKINLVSIGVPGFASAKHISASSLPHEVANPLEYAPQLADITLCGIRADALIEASSAVFVLPSQLQLLQQCEEGALLLERSVFARPSPSDVLERKAECAQLSEQKAEGALLSEQKALLGLTLPAEHDGIATQALSLTQGFQLSEQKAEGALLSEQKALLGRTLPAEHDGIATQALSLTQGFQPTSLEPVEKDSARLPSPPLLATWLSPLPSDSEWSQPLPAPLKHEERSEVHSPETPSVDASASGARGDPKAGDPSPSLQLPTASPRSIGPIVSRPGRPDWH